jgi:hypothetical protein
MAGTIPAGSDAGIPLPSASSAVPSTSNTVISSRWPRSYIVTCNTPSFTENVIAVNAIPSKQWNDNGY